MTKKKNIFQKAVEKFFVNQGKQTIPENYEIKYDESPEETELLGLTNEYGVVIDRDGYNRYMSVVESRKRICELPDFEKLKKDGIVDEKGEILDEKRYNEYQKHMQDIEMMKYHKDRTI
mgnify:CR=1 FL=1